ncbi:hypothetical protein BH10CYA1_BH10CYA1_21850 [soil metagenome]
MLRLFRNLLCLASVLQVGAAVQAQQPASKATAHEAKGPAVSSAKAVKQEPVMSSAKPVKKDALVTSAKTAAPASSAKSPVAALSATTKAPPVPTKAAKTEPATSSPKVVKIEPAAAPSKSSIAVPVAIPSKSGKADTAAKLAKSTEKVVTTKHSTSPRLGLVPPPPPDTPTMFAGGGFSPGFGMVDYNNPAVLAGRRKDIASQLASAKKMLVDKEQRAKELKEKAVQFEQLFSEGVISRRELESVQKDSASAVTELNDARTQATAYQNAMSRLDDRIKPKSVAAKKSAKGKIKASTKNTVKVAGASVTPAETAVTTTKVSTAAASAVQTTTTTTTTTTDSSAQAAIKATPGP